MANQQKQFDIAVLIDSNDQYKAILHGNIVYHMKPRDLHFNTSQRYVQGDINVINDSTNFVQEIDTERYINEYFKNSNNITNSFKTITKIRLFIFKEGCSTLWYSHVNKQTNLPSDAVIIVNNKNQPIYMLHNTNINILNESIKFKSFTPYQGNDIKILNSYASKMKQFIISNKWKINVNKKDNTFKHGISYNFKSNEAKHAFFNQSYDIALITNKSNQMTLVLSDCIYIRNSNILSFKSFMEYKNGIYGKLKQHAELMKSLAIGEYRLENTKKPYVFTGFEAPNKCLLFNIKDIDEWVEYMETQCNAFYDVGVITNKNKKQIYFLNKLHIDLLENKISFGSYEEFAAKHHGLVNKFGKFVKTHSLNKCTIDNLPNDKSKGELFSVNCYLWDLNKPKTQPQIQSQPQTQIQQNVSVKQKNKKIVSGNNGKDNKNKKSVKNKNEIKNKNKKGKNKGKESNKKIVNKNNKKTVNRNISKKSNKKVNNKSVKKDKYNKYNNSKKKVQNNTVKRGNYQKHNQNTSKTKPKYKANNSKKKYDKKPKYNTQKSNKKKDKKKNIKSDIKKDKKDKKKKDKKHKKSKRRKNSVLQPSILKKLERRNSRKNSISLTETDNTLDNTSKKESNISNGSSIKMLSIYQYDVNNELKEGPENNKKESQNVSIATKLNNIKPKPQPLSPVYSPPQTPTKNNIAAKQPNKMVSNKVSNSVNVAPKQSNKSDNNTVNINVKVSNNIPQNKGVYSNGHTAEKQRNNLENKSVNRVPVAPVSLDNNEVINDFNGIWNAYVSRYGFEPKNAYQLQNFTKLNGNIRSLSYKEVRQLFKDRSK